MKEKYAQSKITNKTDAEYDSLNGGESGEILLQLYNYIIPFI